jgi:hypothetical protein
MSWLQKNSFPMALSGFTLLGVAGLFYYGTLGSARYEQAKSDFGQALDEATTIEKTVPYPKDSNRDGKKKAIEDFKKDVETLQQSYASYRSGELQMVSPEMFIDRLKKINEESINALNINAVTFPDGFFCGFKDYTSKLPSKSATGIMGYQLESIRELLLALAESGATEIKNLHRPPLEEESGLVYKPAADAVARPLSLEITFQGPERALRRFVTALSNTDNRYWVIRSMRIGNMKKDPPKTADAQFGAQAARNQQDPAFEDIFNFNEGEKKAAAEGAEVPAPPPAAPAPAVPAAPEGGRILSLILGNEELLVHLRLDLLLFLEPKPLP